MEEKKLYITDTILRDAHQSQAATRMRIEDMLPALEQLDSVGYWSLECWGGATFDACMRFLNEDPWERLRTLKKHMPNTNASCKEVCRFRFPEPAALLYCAQNTWRRDVSHRFL